MKYKQLDKTLESKPAIVTMLKNKNLDKIWSQF